MVQDEDMEMNTTPATEATELAAYEAARKVYVARKATGRIGAARTDASVAAAMILATAAGTPLRAQLEAANEVVAQVVFDIQSRDELIAQNPDFFAALEA